MKKHLLKIVNIFIATNIIFLAPMVSANATSNSAYEIRQKMTGFLEKERKGEEVAYKYLAQQLCIYFNPPKFPDEELTFNTPFGNVKLSINSTRSIFITTDIKDYNTIGSVLDNFLTKNGRKKLAKIILKYLQTSSDEEYKIKPFNTYKFEDEDEFFSLENKLWFKLESKGNIYINMNHKLEELNKKIGRLRSTAEIDLQSIRKDLKRKKEITSARKKIEELNRFKKNLEFKMSKIRKSDEEKLDKAKSAAKALCAILMIAEPHYKRSFDGGKHERALMREVFSEASYTKSFEKFVPSRKGGASLAYEYSTTQDQSRKILESNCYSDDEIDFEQNKYPMFNLFKDNTSDDEQN